jgi:hypothetical protein
MAESKSVASHGRFQQQQQQQQQQPLLTPRGGDRPLRYSPQRAPQSLHNHGQANYTRFDSPRTQTGNGPQQMSHQPISTARFQTASTQQQQAIRGAGDGHGLGASSYYLPQNEVKLRRRPLLANNRILFFPSSIPHGHLPFDRILFILCNHFHPLV